MAEYTHLLYVRKYSIVTNDYELYVYGVNTTDIYHTIGEMYSRSMEHIARIDFVELTPDNAQAKFDFWKCEGKEILTWHDKYKTERVPAADVVPVVHGRWILGHVEPGYFTPGGNRPWVCSECGRVISWMLDRPRENYCPNCGAKMDGGNHEQET